MGLVLFLRRLFGKYSLSSLPLALYNSPVMPAICNGFVANGKPSSQLSRAAETADVRDGMDHL